MPRSSPASLKGIGPVKAELLNKELGISTVEDLLYFAPRRYIDYSYFTSIRKCLPGENAVSIIGVVSGTRILGGKKKFLEVTVEDGTGSFKGIFFAAIPYFQKIFIPGETVIFSGIIQPKFGLSMIHPEFDFTDENSTLKSINAGRIIPIYRTTEKLRKNNLESRGLRKIIKEAIEKYISSIKEPFEPSLLVRYGLMEIREALQKIHFPDSHEDAVKARTRLVFNEMFYYQYYLAYSRHISKNSSAKDKKSADTEFIKNIISKLPFELTADQKSAVETIRIDLESPCPMNRLLQGDVGSGKTVVAALAAAVAVSLNRQTVLMAPTGVLAEQHFFSFSKLLPAEVKTSILTGKTPPKEKRTLLNRVISGEIDVLIGTQALLYNEIEFRSPGLIIIDEQHKFGVEQRASLRRKSIDSDLLIMTATPIPRSLTLTIFGDLDVSSIKSMPSGRIPVTTLAFTSSRIKGVYNSVLKYVQQGRQVYYVYPLIEESEKTDLKSAVEGYNRLKNEVFPGLRVGLLHGRMKDVEKSLIMERMFSGEIDILVSTTVIEVGLDIPNASVIIIEHAERFGLAQLHQLRGRVGRGAHQSFCILLHDEGISERALRRIDTLVSTANGFEIAEIDLQMRGSGEIRGLLQHGRDSGFEFTDISRDMDIIKAARAEAVAKANEISPANGDLNDEKIWSGLRKKRILSLLS